MTPRDMVVQALTATIPTDITVQPYPRTLDAVVGRQVFVAMDVVAPDPAQPLEIRDYSFQLFVVTAFTDPGPADDDLDATLEDVLAALDEADDLTWTNAQRGVLADSTTPCYVVTVPVVARHERP